MSKSQKFSVIAILMTLPAARLLVVKSRQEASLDVVQVTSQGDHALANESSCVDCHDQATEFFETGHARTLHRASDEYSLKLLRYLNSTDAVQGEGTALHVNDGQPIVISSSGDIERQLKLDWCFGSGTHACTWVATLKDSRNHTDSLEYRWTWFSSIEGIAQTPGQPSLPGKSAASAHGLMFDGPKAIRCFSCHSSHLKVNNGQLDENSIHAGVTCQRCHGPRQRHVDSDGVDQPMGWQWKDIDRMEAVNRCAVCHRLPGEKKPDEIRPGNPDIVRFQPMGLLQSKCFLNSQMTCTTCHDPHRTMHSQNSAGIWQCIQCHDPQESNHILCGAGETEGCLGCHMPKVDTGFPVNFTDHWIRVPDDKGQAP